MCPKLANFLNPSLARVYNFCLDVASTSRDLMTFPSDCNGPHKARILAKSWSISYWKESLFINADGYCVPLLGRNTSVLRWGTI